MERPGVSPTPAEQLRADAIRAGQGDRLAFHRLVRATARLALTTIVLEVRDPHLADDLTQETYLRAWRSIGTLNDPGKFNAWLIGIAKSVCVDAHKHRSRKKRTAPQSTDDAKNNEHLIRDPGPDPLEQLSQSDRREQLLAALESLPMAQKQVLSMRYLAGADYETIAAQLNLTDGALRGHLHRGLAALRENFPALSPTGHRPA